MRLNALRDADANLDFWDIKDLAGKKQNLIYGRAIYAYHADSVNGYKAYLENVDVYDFLIDPSGGGLDMEKAKYMGRYGVVKDRYEIKKDKSYIKSEVKLLLGDGDNTGTGNANEITQEESNKRNRHQAVETQVEVQKPDKDKFKFWEWYTTFEGERYYLLMQETGVAIRVECLTDLFPATKNFRSGLAVLVLRQESGSDGVLDAGTCRPGARAFHDPERHRQPDARQRGGIQQADESGGRGSHQEPRRAEIPERAATSSPQVRA